jgi:outer membrane lipoprotein-sorting protein
MQRQTPRTPVRTERRALVLGVALAGCLAAAARPSTAAPRFDLATLTALLAQVRSGEATFTETRRIEMLDRTLESAGRLSFRAPDVFVRETLRPRRERLAVEGNTLTMSMGERSRTMQLDASPEAAVIVEAVRGTLTGNRQALERLFETALSGSADAWTLDLVPRDARLRGQVAQVRVAGRGPVVRQVQVLLADGDRSVMTISPVQPARPPS